MSLPKFTDHDPNFIHQCHLSHDSDSMYHLLKFEQNDLRFDSQHVMVHRLKRF